MAESNKTSTTFDTLKPAPEPVKVAPEAGKEVLDPNTFDLVYEGERPYYKNFKTGRCFATRALVIELDPKTLLPKG
jgi:hypothetical protein